MAVAWQWHGSGMAVAWQWHGSGMCCKCLHGRGLGVGCRAGYQPAMLRLQVTCYVAAEYECICGQALGLS
jgi:hypothetical protein